jgi:adenylate cyclase
MVTMKKSITLARNFFIISAILIVLSPSYFRIFDNFELATLDLRYKLRPIQPQSEDVVIVEIAGDTLKKIGRWPFTRNWHAAIIDILSASGAKAIVFDVLFTEPSEHDQALVESTKKAGNVYYACTFDLLEKHKKGVIKAGKIDAFPLPDLQAGCRGFGFINFIPDSDGRTRRVPLKINYNGRDYSHLALRVAEDYLGKRIEDINIPVDERSLALVNFAGKWHETYKHYSYVDIIKSYSLLEKGQKGIVDLNGLRDRVCFIGLTATAAHDTMPIPQEEIYPGLGIHTNLFNSIVTQNFLRRAHRLTNLAILIFLGVVAGSVAVRARPVVSSVFIVLAIILLCFLSWGLFVFANVWIDLFYPIIGLIIIYLTLIFYKYISERQKRQLIERELEVASKIQKSFLPQESPKLTEVTMIADMSPAKQIGGDLYDFVELQDNRVGVMVGDVSGKGVPAALYMARAGRIAC